MQHSVYILNGPNLDLLGLREPHLYGHTTLAQIEERCRALAAQEALEIFFGQSNYEGQIVDWVHEARTKNAAVIVNPAGLSFFSVPVLDSLKTISEPVFEVHITNIHRRDPLYQKSIVSYGVTGVICGLGPFGYQAAILAVVDHYAGQETSEPS
jgi:3-dehydroquinate dehydratase-2